MSLSNNFPLSPYVSLDPSIRWFPDFQTSNTQSKLIPPLVPELRKQVKIFRDNGYQGAYEQAKVFLIGGSIQSILCKVLMV